METWHTARFNQLQDDADLVANLWNIVVALLGTIFLVFVVSPVLGEAPLGVRSPGSGKFAARPTLHRGHPALVQPIVRSYMAERNDLVRR
ncbi:hypothetical protein V495_06829 [Pseudogymnoascus sp. VKM F-4514 (FW-929)]|jgi:hypothetical protein|nr:hypothetical protein V495_06829 [Pseudogymnoascus sp. VKM F-4514 (FW-929)]KFY61074.1 hypothetical protein V497_03200 [Pseudogymnoascus sp. VKM F-4516 (FW-969)]